MSTHSLARELLQKEDGFVVAQSDDKEYAIANIKRVFTHANSDDRVFHWVFTLKECGEGNIKR